MKDEPRIDGGPYHIEPDETEPSPFTLPNRWRIVSDKAKERITVIGTTARPQYIATVYSESDAMFICELLNRHSRNRHT